MNEKYLKQSNQLLSHINKDNVIKDNINNDIKYIKNIINKQNELPIPNELPTPNEKKTNCIFITNIANGLRALLGKNVKETTFYSDTNLEIPNITIYNKIKEIFSIIDYTQIKKELIKLVLDCWNRSLDNEKLDEIILENKAGKISTILLSAITPLKI